MTAFEAEEQLRREIAADESLLWSGVPRGGLALQASDAFQIPFGILWCVLVGRSLMGAWSRGTPPIGLIFAVAVGLYLLAGRFFVDAYARSRTAYGLTSRRILIVSGIFSRSVTSQELDLLPGTTMTQNRDGSGTITFGTPDPVFKLGHNRRPDPKAFERIPDVGEVYARIQEARSRYKK